MNKLNTLLHRSGLKSLLIVLLLIGMCFVPDPFVYGNWIPEEPAGMTEESTDITEESTDITEDSADTPEVSSHMTEKPAGSPGESGGIPSTSDDRPNILLIISDDLNTRIGPYMDLPDHTPNLNRLADEGVRFTRAYCQYPLCGPSRASLMSGLYPETNGVLRNNDQPGSYPVATPGLADHPSMAGFFRQRGYFTARVSKIYHMGVPGGIERGEPGGDEPGSWDYAYNVMAPETQSDGTLELLSPKNLHYGSNFARMILDDSLDISQADHLATNQAIAILESRMGTVAEGARNKTKLKPDAPFFLAVGLVRPHVPFIAPERCFAPYPADDVELPSKEAGEVPVRALRRQNQNIWGMSPLQERQTIAAYMASVQFMDEQVGRLLNTLDRLGAREETIVIFLSDHGYNLGEHDCWSKVSLWEGSVRVPLILSWHGIGGVQGRTCGSVVELIDLYPTLAELCGFGEEAPGILQGESLVPQLMAASEQEETDGYAYMVTNGGADGALRTGRWKYHRWGEEALPENEELYDHLSDPEEFVNLAGNAAYREVLERLRAKYDEIRLRAQQSKPGFDKQTATW